MVLSVVTRTMAECARPVVPVANGAAQPAAVGPVVRRVVPRVTVTKIAIARSKSGVIQITNATNVYRIIVFAIALNNVVADAAIRYNTNMWVKRYVLVWGSASPRIDVSRRSDFPASKQWLYSVATCGLSVILFQDGRIHGSRANQVHTADRWAGNDAVDASHAFRSCVRFKMGSKNRARETVRFQLGRSKQVIEDRGKAFVRRDAERSWK
jgi:hypothetical protein